MRCVICNQSCKPKTHKKITSRLRRISEKHQLFSLLTENSRSLEHLVWR